MHGRGSKLVKWGPHKWVLDSGAWIHRTSNPLVVLDEGDHWHWQWQFQDQKMARSLYVQLGLRSVRTERFDFPGVQYVAGDDDDDARNVVSVSQLARDHGLVTVFEPTSCHVKDKKTGQIVGKGRLRNGMYMLDYLRVVGQYMGDGGARSGGERGDGEGGGSGHGGRGNNGEGRAGGGRRRDGRGEGTGASRNQEQGGGGSGAAGGDINDEEIVNEEEEEGRSENEMNDENVDQDDDGTIHQEINGNGEEEDNERGGGSTFGESSNRARTGLLGLSRFALVLRLCIAVCILSTLCKFMLATFNNLDFHSLPGLLLPFILSLQLLRNLSKTQSTSRKLVKQIGSLFRGRSRDGEGKQEGTSGDYVHESSNEHNRRLFGLSRFDATTDPTGYWRRQLPARAFPTSTNAARHEDFLVDSGASFHTTWKESILFPYPRHLHDHTKPPTLSLGGIAAGSIAVTRSGYLNGDNIMLDGVLLALQAQANLVSVGQLSIYYGVQVEMDEVGVVIKKKQDGVQIGGGRMLNNLYVLEYFLPGGLFAHCPTPHP
ncbi:uncharacterized protein [Miscanthus floridulus]|uniref:uncharacterized protein n=1 Tax=Miscanthus floridulus TaxID=154761 RepID=UPI0034580AC2